MQFQKRSNRKSTPKSARSLKNSKSAVDLYEKVISPCRNKALEQLPTTMKRKIRKTQKQPEIQHKSQQPILKLQFKNRTGSAGKQNTYRKSNETDRNIRNLRHKNKIQQTSRTVNQQAKCIKSKSKARIKQLQDSIRQNIKQIEFLKSIFTTQQNDRIQMDSLRDENSQLKAQLSILKQTNHDLQKQLLIKRDISKQMQQINKAKKDQFIQYDKSISQQIDQLKSQILYLKTHPARDSTKQGSYLDSQPAKDITVADKNNLNMIKLLITYRFQALFLTHHDIKDAFNQDRYYQQHQIQQMLPYQPFLLNNRQSVLVTKVILKSGKGSDLVLKLGQWLGQIQKIDQQQEQQMVDSLAQFVTQYQDQLKKAIFKFSSDQQWITKQRMSELLNQIGLDNNFCELVIRRLSLYSQQLQKLSISAFWDTFVQGGGGYGKIDECDQLSADQFA